MTAFLDAHRGADPVLNDGFLLIGMTDWDAALYFGIFCLTLMPYIFFLRSRGPRLFPTSLFLGVSFFLFNYSMAITVVGWLMIAKVGAGDGENALFVLELSSVPVLFFVAHILTARLNLPANPFFCDAEELLSSTPYGVLSDIRSEGDQGT